MTRIVDFIFLIFAAFLGKKALLLSVFAFAPSVLANDIPLATLSVDNIQVRAEWDVVGDDEDYFSVEGGTLMLRSNVTWAGYPEGSTITAIVEVLDKFSTLNPSYEDLTVRVMITAVIMGCYPHWTGNFAKFAAVFSVVHVDSIKVGDVIAREHTENGHNHIFLHTVSAVHSRDVNGTYISTMPDLSEYLNSGYEPHAINGSADCFAGEVKYNNTPVTGLYAGTGARAISVVASVSNNQQIFSLDDVELANALNELYTIKVIIDDGKVFSIDGKRQNGDRYEYFANLTDGSVTVQNTISHEVIIFNGDCPPVYNVNGATLGDGNMYIAAKDYDKVKAYVLIDGKVYKSNIDIANSLVVIEGYSVPLTTNGSHTLKFSDHFLCGIE